MGRCTAVAMLLAAMQAIACGDNAADTGIGGPTDAGADRERRSTIPEPSPDARVPTVAPVATSDLPFDVIDAAYSSALDRIVIASALPAPALYLLDPSSLVAIEIPLPLAPTCVSVAPDGLTAAVGDDGQVTWVDLVKPSITSRCYVGPATLDVALAGGGRVYVTGGFEGMRGSDLAACLDLTADELMKPNDTKLGVDGARNVLYAASNNTSGQAIRMYDVAMGRPVPIGDLAYDVHFSDCGQIWMTEDGRGFLRCGYVLENRTIRPLALSFEVIAAAAATSRGILIVPDADPFTRMRPGMPYAYVYDEHFGPVRKVDLASGDDSDPPHGRFAFGHAAGDRWYVITSRGAMPSRYALATIDAGN